MVGPHALGDLSHWLSFYQSEHWLRRASYKSDQLWVRYASRQRVRIFHFEANHIVARRSTLWLPRSVCGLPQRKCIPNFMTFWIHACNCDRFLQFWRVTRILHKQEGIRINTKEKNLEFNNMLLSAKFLQQLPKIFRKIWKIFPKIPLKFKKKKRKKRKIFKPDDFATCLTLTPQSARNERVAEKLDDVKRIGEKFFQWRFFVTLLEP